MNDLNQLLERATANLDPDVGFLVRGATVRGRRLRNRRRVATGIGAVAAVAVVGTTAVVAPSYVGGSPQVGPASSPPVTQAKTQLLPGRGDLAQGRVVTLPTGSTLIRAWGSRKEDFVAAAWRYTPVSGGGAGRVEVLVEHLGDGKSIKRGPADAATACHQDPGHCTRQPDGSWLSTFTAPEPLPGGGDSAVIGAHASLWRADGLHLTATAYNAMGEKDEPVTRATPVLDVAQLTDLLSNAHLD